jgi:hypothetical protein
MGLDMMPLTTWMTQRMELQCCNCSSALYHGLRCDASDYLDGTEGSISVNSADKPHSHPHAPVGMLVA